MVVRGGKHGIHVHPPDQKPIIVKCLMGVHGLEESYHFISIDNSGKLYLISYIILNIFQNGKGILRENRKIRKSPRIID